MLLLESVNTLLEADDAEFLAGLLNADDDDWVYSVIHDPVGSGKSFIEVHDETGLLLGRL